MLSFALALRFQIRPLCPQFQDLILGIFFSLFCIVQVAPAILDGAPGRISSGQHVFQSLDVARQIFDALVCRLDDLIERSLEFIEILGLGRKLVLNP